METYKLNYKFKLYLSYTKTLLLYQLCNCIIYHKSVIQTSTAKEFQ